MANFDFFSYLTEDQIKNFWSFVLIKTEDECWNFVGGLCTNGYGHFGLKINDKDFKGTVAHRIAWSIKNGRIPDSLVVRHKCIGNRRCCNPKHLLLGTQQDNANDCIEQGRTNIGIKNINAKLTEKDIIEIRVLLASNIMGTKIARKFGVHKSIIYDIRDRKIWKHIK